MEKGVENECYFSPCLRGIPFIETAAAAAAAMQSVPWNAMPGLSTDEERILDSGTRRR